MTSSMAFCWADEPSAFSVPLKQAASPDGDGAALPPPPDPEPLLSLPQAVSRSAPAASATAVLEKRVSFTVVSSKDVCASAGPADLWSSPVATGCLLVTRRTLGRRGDLMARPG